MDFIYDDEQDALREAVRGLVGKAYGDYENRRQAVADDPGFDEKLWARMAEMGLLGLPFAEEDGGVGAGPVEIGIVCQELGRVIAPEPYLTSVVLAGGLVSAVGTAEQRQEVLGALSAGESVLAFAHDEPGRGWTPGAEKVTAAQDGDSWTLTGVKEPVPHGARADVLVVSAALPDGGTGLFLVEGEAADRTGYPTYDGTRAARVTFDGTAATPLGEPGLDVTASIATVQDITRVMAANQALGAMQFLLPTTTEYLRSRKQFGVPLTTFQALTFRAADMYVSLELTHSMVDWATMVVAAGRPGGGRRRRAPRLAPGEHRRPARRPGGDPAARRHRDDHGVLRRHGDRPPHRARPPARRRRAPPARAGRRRDDVRRARPARLTAPT